MKIEKLNEDKIRITLNMEDLKENDIDFQTFMSNSIESQELFMNMLDKAEKEVGFITEDYRIMIEALAMTNGNFVLTVTRLPEKQKNTYKKKKLNIKRKSTQIDSKKAIYCFDSFDEFCEYCKFIQSDTLKIVEELAECISLYEYHNKYYLIFNNLCMNISLLKSFSASITEFAHFVNGDSSLFESKLIEYGSILFKQNAISQCFKHFA